MDSSGIATLAGITSTVIFASSVLPMLVKARRTRDLSSYSLGHIVLANVGNVVHSVYVLSLPPGPIWALHGFYVVSSALMLLWFLQGTATVRAAACAEVPTTSAGEMGRPSDAAGACAP